MVWRDSSNLNRAHYDQLSALEAADGMSQMLYFSLYHMGQPLNSNSNCSLKNEEFIIKYFFKVPVLQCNYTFEYGVILNNYMYLLYG